MADEHELHDDFLYFNGVNVATGDYGIEPLSQSAFRDIVKTSPDQANQSDLKNRKAGSEEHFGLRSDLDPTDMTEAGWGVIFPARTDPAVKDALKELLDLRREQAGDLFRLYEGTDVDSQRHGYLPDERAVDFLIDRGGALGAADPFDKGIPYYLLIVGSPEEIPYEFQYELSVQYAVGRVHFDTVQEYANYAHTVVESERQNIALARDLAFFGVRNADDQATRLSSEILLDNLLQYLQGDRAQKRIADWRLNTFLGEQAHKNQLGHLLGGDQTPAVLFTASHGVEFPYGDPRQVLHQGGLLCSDWPGPRAWRGKGELPEDFYFSGQHVASDARLAGVIAFFFACFGAGTPTLDEFFERKFTEPHPIAERPFIASLPRRMLGHEKGGALAVIGHVERAWGLSFVWTGGAKQTDMFETAMLDILTGKPVGLAMESIADRWAEYSVRLTQLTQVGRVGGNPDPYEMARFWTANNDARGYVILGDPAVRAAVAASDDAARPRPELAITTVAATGGDGATTGDGAVLAAGAAVAGMTVAGTETATTAMAATEADVDFGVRETVADVVETLRAAASRLADAVGKAVEDITTLNVLTYTSPSLTPASVQSQDTARVLRAATRLKFDGDVETVVPVRSVEDPLADEPRSEMEIDQELWQIHLDMVDIARQNRLDFMKTAAEVAGTLLEALT